ncbi:thiaminase II [Rapidithrix thailandica]|uniref:Aminopyrimidine aminohydrolase n=1 Tax=Rapidithrix thailandica TaxID=413964 RepID=A0AAW9RS77_9BACT
MIWSKETWQQIEPVYQEIIALPFIHELKEGILPKEKFLFYIQQDALYLAEFGKVLSGIAGKLSSFEHIQAFLGFSKDTIIVEKALHETFLNESTLELKPSPTCLLYTNFMHAQLATQALPVAMASVLPCFWIYKEVGDYITEHQIPGDNPYQDWIDTYSGEEFAEAVKKAIAICDEIAETCTETQRATMTEAFVMASRMEWMFWDSAYRQEKWPV